MMRTITIMVITIITIATISTIIATSTEVIIAMISSGDGNNNTNVVMCEHGLQPLPHHRFY